MPVVVRRHRPRPEPALLRPCAREGRARRRGNQDVYGDFTYLDDGTGAGFQWVGYPTGGACTPVLQHRLPRRRRLPAPRPRHAHAPDAAHHVEAARREAELLRDRLEGRELQQHRRLRVHAHPGVLAAQPDQADDVLATRRRSTTGPSCPRPASTGAAPSATRCRPPPPTSRSSRSRPRRLSPGRRCALPRRSPSSAGRRSRERAATGSRSPRSRRSRAPIEDVLDPSTSYTPFTTYPADTDALLARPRRRREPDRAHWSSVRTFQRKLPAPTTDPANPTIGDFTPAWLWSNVTGASGYTFSIDGPDGSHNEYTGLRDARQPRSSTSSGRASGAGACAPSSRSCRRAPSPGRGRRTSPSRGR